MAISTKQALEILPTGDGTGDGVIVLSDVLLSTLGWAMDEQIEIIMLDNGSLQFSKAQSSVE